MARNFAWESREPLAVSQASDEMLRAARVLLVALFVGIMFFASDHEWLTSRFESFAGSSDFMETVTTQGNFSRRAAIFALGLASLIVLLRSGGFRLQLRGLLATLIIATAAWSASSWFWSIDPSIAARRLISTACVGLAALAAARLLRPRELIAVAMICSAGYIAVGVLTEIALGTFHPWTADYRFAGTVHPNMQGVNCALLVMSAGFLAVKSQRRRALLWALVATGLVGLWLTKSRTSLAALVIAEAVYWLILASWQKKLIAVLAAIFVVCSLTLITGENILGRVAEAALLGRGNDDDAGLLSGRVPLWEELDNSISQHPWRGFGFSSFWTPNNIEDVSETQGWAISVAHSAYLDLTLSVGLIGAGFCVAVALVGLIQAFYLQAGMPAVGFGFTALILLFALVHGITESAFADPGFVPLVAWSGLAMLALVNPQQYKSTDTLEAAAIHD